MRARRLMRVAGALLFVILLSMAGELQPARAALPEAEQVFFVPLPEATVDAALTAVGATTTGTMHSVISITAVADDTIIYYDEWHLLRRVGGRVRTGTRGARPVLDPDMG